MKNFNKHCLWQVRFQKLDSIQTYNFWAPTRPNLAVKHNKYSVQIIMIKTTMNSLIFRASVSVVERRHLLYHSKWSSHRPVTISPTTRFKSVPFQVESFGIWTINSCFRIPFVFQVVSSFSNHFQWIQLWLVYMAPVGKYIRGAFMAVRGSKVFFAVWLWIWKGLATTNLLFFVFWIFDSLPILLYCIDSNQLV